VQVKIIKGVFDTGQKQDMISQLTETMVGIEGEALRGVTWVTIEEVESGDWGIGGNAITRRIRARPAAEPSRRSLGKTSRGSRR
jgi:4-oxalocrotonate tautomerase